jgi:hypothetical protein
MSSPLFGWQSPEVNERRNNWREELRGRRRNGGIDESADDVRAMLCFGGGAFLGRFFPGRTSGRHDDDSRIDVPGARRREDFRDGVHVSPAGLKAQQALFTARMKALGAKP